MFSGGTDISSKIKVLRAVAKSPDKEMQTRTFEDYAKDKSPVLRAAVLEYSKDLKNKVARDALVNDLSREPCVLQHSGGITHEAARDALVKNLSSHPLVVVRRMVWRFKHGLDPVVPKDIVSLPEAIEKKINPASALGSRLGVIASLSSEPNLLFLKEAREVLKRLVSDPSWKVRVWIPEMLLGMKNDLLQDDLLQDELMWVLMGDERPEVRSAVAKYSRWMESGGTRSDILQTLMSDKDNRVCGEVVPSAGALKDEASQTKVMQTLASHDNYLVRKYVAYVVRHMLNQEAGYQILLTLLKDDDKRVQSRVASISDETRSWVFNGKVRFPLMTDKT